ncbi:PhnE/PtxC family ABC transporter permease [Ureaplasma zalophigenitalium]|uniref:ABC transporter permease subunit n=1 Tax=Ureaplasma zalophigenitalium TaxID=907723 RepID=A0ABT3BNW5_9BACT|nr:ABC transporter permease subunit [Ureaplasma zalophigenitalium]MCV3753956.1 ABC transporter permease subunit [Ureaplasma zalophigenitalium]
MNNKQQTLTKNSYHRAKIVFFLQKIKNYFQPKFIDINGQKVTKSFPWFSVISILASLLIVAVIIWAVKPNFSGHDIFWKNISGFFDFKTTEVAGYKYTPTATFIHALKYLWKTISFSILGTLLGILISVPVALLSSKNFIKTPLVYMPMRILMSIMRAIPPIVFAFGFKNLVSKELAATFALALFVTAVMAKWLYEDLDTYDVSAYHGMQAIGNTKLVAFKNSILPYLNKRIFAYGFYSFEMVVRFAAILSIVGIPTIGESISNYQEPDKFGGLNIVLWTLITFMVILEVLNFLVRKYFLEAIPKRPVVDEHLPYDQYLKALKKQRPKIYLWKIALAVIIITLSIAALFQIKWQAANKIQVFYFVKGMQAFFSPEWSLFSVWDHQNVFRLGFDALAVAILATLIGTLLAIPIALLASFNITKWTSLIFKLVIIILRAIPAFTFAFLFLALSKDSIVFAGVLALGIHSIGMMGKLTTQAIEKIPQRFFESLDSIGANTWLKFKYTLKEIMPTIISNFLYRIEINFKSTTVIGTVGASKFGLQINIFSGDPENWNRLSSYLIFTVVLLMILEYLSSLLRKKIMTGYFFEQGVWFKRLLRYYKTIKALAIARTFNISFANHYKPINYNLAYRDYMFLTIYRLGIEHPHIDEVSYGQCVRLDQLCKQAYRHQLKSIRNEINDIKLKTKNKVLRNMQKAHLLKNQQKQVKKAQFYAINHYLNEKAVDYHVS